MVAVSPVIQLPGNGSVHGRERVIQEVEVGLVVDSPGQAHPRLLPPTQSDSPLPHLRQVTVQQLSYVLQDNTQNSRT